MSDSAEFYLRINGIAHAFCRQVGCPCRRCTTIDYAMRVPTGRLEAFDGWPDPPWRAHTSASLLVPDGDDPERVGRHVLFDMGSGVAESLAASQIPAIEDEYAGRDGRGGGRLSKASSAASRTCRNTGPRAYGCRPASLKLVHISWPCAKAIAGK